MRSPGPAPEWLSGLLSSEVGRAFSRGAFRRFRGGAVREAFAGSGLLSKALGACGLWVEPALEAYPEKGKYIAALDLDRAEVRFMLLQEIRSGFLRYVHFGLPCGAWGPANRLNKGTRSRASPDGGPNLLERERKANEQGAYVAMLCIELSRAKGWFSVENPYSSDFWRSSFYCTLVAEVQVSEAHIHQCAYGLKLPGFDRYSFCKKDTRIVSNIPDIVNLSRSCPGISA